MLIRPAAGSAWLAVVFLFALTISITWPLATQLTISLPGDYGDPLFVSWAMGWVAGWLADAFSNPATLRRLWDANILFPEPQTLAFSEHFLAQSVMTLPVYLISGNLLLAYNVAFLASFVLTGLGTFLLARSLTGSTRGAYAAAVIAAFNQYRLEYEVAHLHVLSIHWFPFALYFLHRYFATDARRHLAYAAGALIALNLSSIYYMAYCAPFVLIFALFELVQWRRWRTPRVWLELWAAAALVVVVTAPVLMPYLEVQRRLGVVRPIAEVIAYSATIDHYRVALPGLLPALALGVIAVLGLALDRKSGRRWATMSSLVLLVLAFWLSLGPAPQSAGQPLGVPGLYKFFYDYVPGYQGLRVPSRFAALLFVFLALVASAGVAVIERRSKALATWILIPTVIAFVMLASSRAMPLNQALASQGLAPPPAYLTPAGTLPAVYRAVDSLSPGAIIAEFPFGDPWYDLRYMYFAATHRRRLLNGYSGIFPPSYLARQRVLTKPTLDPERAAQAIASATHVVVHRHAWPDNTGLLVGAWLETLGARAIADADGAVVYEMPLREEMAGPSGYNKKAAGWLTSGLFR
jgi:hypothetical protein